MSPRRKQQPNRNATRRPAVVPTAAAPTSAASGSAASGGAASGSPAHVDGVPDLVSDGMAPELAELLRPLAQGLMDQLAGARSPLDAEFGFAEMLAMIETSAPPEATEDDLAQMTSTVLTRVIDWAETTASPDALVLLRVAATLSDDVTRSRAAAAADRVAACGVADRPWAHALGRPVLLRAWRYADVYGEQESVALQYDYHHREHTICVLIDHQLGGGVKDCWVGEGSKARSLRQRTLEEMADDPDAVFEDLDAEAASTILAEALDRKPCPVQDDQLEDVPLTLPILRSRARSLAATSAARS